MTTPQETSLAPVERQNYVADWWNPKTLDEAHVIAERMAKSQLVPTGYRGKPEDIVVAWSLGAPLGLSLLSSLQHIAVINGRPSIWGDAALAVCKAHPKCEWVHEELLGDGDEMVAICRVKRRGEPKAVERTFSVEDAKRAKLWGDSKKTPWLQYPKRMLQMRARGFALRDCFPDALCGMPLAEEIRDITADVTVTETEPEGSTRTEQLKRRLRPKSEDEPPAPAMAADADVKRLADWARGHGYPWEELHDFIREACGKSVERLGELTADDVDRVLTAAEEHDRETGA